MVKNVLLTNSRLIILSPHTLELGFREWKCPWYKAIAQFFYYLFWVRKKNNKQILRPLNKRSLVGQKVGI